MKDASKIQDSVIDPLLTYFRTELDKTNPSIQSPAAQRAYLLSNRPENGKIITKVCDDPWKNSNLSSIPAYALFKTIHKSLLKEGTELQIAKPKFIEVLKGFNGRIESSDTDVLWGNKFKGDFYSDVKPYCDQISGIESKEATAKIKEAYRRLKQLYSQHLQNVLLLLKELFVITPEFEAVLSSPLGFEMGLEKPIIQLHPMFATQGAPEYLEQVTKKAIMLLDTHYSEVESIYGKAIRELGMVGKPGNGKASNFTTTLANTPTGGRRTRRQSSELRTAFRKNPARFNRTRNSRSRTYRR
jgi:hypothetical protein